MREYWINERLTMINEEEQEIATTNKRLLF